MEDIFKKGLQLFKADGGTAITKATSLAALKCVAQDEVSSRKINHNENNDSPRKRKFFERFTFLNDLMAHPDDKKDALNLLAADYFFPVSTQETTYNSSEQDPAANKIPPMKTNSCLLYLSPSLRD